MDRDELLKNLLLNVSLQLNKVNILSDILYYDFEITVT